MGDIPASVHYRLSKNIAESCSTCEFWAAGNCTMFNAPVSATYVCDEWEKPKPPPPPPVAPTAAHHNRVIAAGYDRADDLVPRMVNVLTPILRKAGRDAAANFTANATNHLTAAARRDADMAALVGLAPAEARSLVASLALTAAAPTPLSTMVCLKPTAEQAAALTVPTGDPVGMLHVTLASLGEVEGPLDMLGDALRLVAANCGPLTGVVAGSGEFGKPDGDTIGILLPDVPGLVELRVAVTQALVKYGVEYARDHGFEAHASTGTPDAPDTAAVFGLPLTFDTLYVVRGDQVEIALPLTGGMPLTAAAAKKPPVALTPEQLAARKKAVEDAKDELRTALADGSDPAHVEAAKKNLRDAQTDLYAASAQNPVWAAPAPAELLDVDALILSLRTKTEPVRQAMVEATARTSIEQAGINFDVSNPYVDAAIKDTASQIPGIAQTTLDNVTKVIQASYQQGLSIPDTAKAIQVGMNEQSFTRATLIARTTLVGATAAGSLAATQAIDAATGGNANYMKRWLTAPGATYPRHELVDGLDGQTQPLDAPFDVDGDSLMYPGDPGGDPANVCNCVAEGTTVRLPGMRYATRRRYKGDLVRIRFANGDNLAVTPNHPLLRSDGRWLPAHMLHEGDHCVGGEFVGNLMGQPDVKDIPTEVGEIYCSAELMSQPVRINLSPEDFHGDVLTDGYVDVVSVDGTLPLNDDLPGLDEIAKLGFSFAEQARFRERGVMDTIMKSAVTRRVVESFQDASLNIGVRGERTSVAHIERSSPMRLVIRTPSSISCESQIPALGGGSVSHTDVHGFASPPQFDSSLRESERDDVTRDIEVCGKRLDALAVEVSLHEIVHIEVESAWVGSVYNFDTGHGFYLTGNGGVICGNCRCTLVYQGGPDSGDTVTADDGG